MGDTGTDIIIKGGSVEVSFNGTVYQKEPGDPKRHRNTDRRITRVRVEDENQQSLFDSDTNDEGLMWTITVSTATE
jgi:hypothetical protein